MSRIPEPATAAPAVESLNAQSPDEAWGAIMANAREIRRQLHRHPELGWQEEQTAAFIRNQLTSLDIPWRACARTGTVAQLNPQAKGKHIALRADIDALPINEKSGVDWASTHDGCMHACGHDGHSATLLAATRWLKLHESKLPGPVSLLFQPAEEGGHGAREMINDGALEGIDEIYGWHNWPALEFGQLICPDGLVMCGNGTFTITVQGRGGHASQPEACNDPVLGASAIVVALQEIVSRRLPPQQTVVVSVTSFEAPSAPTVIPDQAVLAGSIRVPDQATCDRVNALITEISEATAQRYGLQCQVDIHPRYQATINHAHQAHCVREIWRELHGEQGLDSKHPVPIMASEDFSYYLREIPGAFALVGSNDGKHEHSVPCHNAGYDFNDKLIPEISKLFIRLAGLPVAAK